MSLPAALGTWLADRCPSEAALCARVAAQLAEARLAGETALAIAPDELARLLACGAAAAEAESAPLTVRYSQIAWSACAHDEDDVAARLRLLAAQSSDASLDLPPGGDPNQDAAVRHAATRRLTVIVGGPGTGKTTTVLRALAALLAGGLTGPIVLAAPTGKAAARLRAAVEHGLDRAPEGVRSALAEAAAQSTTVHRLLGLDVATGRFRYGPGRRLPAAAVVVDEASMLDIHLAAGLARALAPDARLILLGDDGQLPSVEAGAVLRDVVAGLPEVVVRLTTVHRQAGAGQGLRALCPALRIGDAPMAAAVLAAGHDDLALIPHAKAWPHLHAMLEPWARAVVEAPNPAAALAALAGQLVLAAVRDGPWGVADLHRRIEGLLGGRPDSAAPLHAHGRPLLVTANDHRLGLSNGDLGVLWSEGGRLLACFPDRAGGVRRLAPARLPACETGWVTTVHKAQGGEAPAVIAVLPPRPHPLATRELLYTAVTRARRRATIVGEPAGLADALARRVQRCTGLAALLRRT